MLSPCDLPSGWELRIIQDSEDQHRTLFMVIGSFAENLGKAKGESQGLSGPAGEVNAYPLVSKDSEGLKDLLEFVERNSTNLGVQVAPVGGGLVVAATSDKEIARTIFDIYATGYGHSILRRARANLSEGKPDDASKLLEGLAKSSRVSPQIKAEMADLYLDFEPPRAQAALALCEEAAKEAGQPCGVWGACARGRAKYHLGRLDEAKAELSVAVKQVDRQGYRALCKALGTLAAVNARTGEAAECREIMAKILEIEARFGGTSAAKLAGTDETLRNAVGQDQLKSLLAPFKSKKPVEVFTDPGSDVSLSRIEVLVMPPIFRKGTLRKDFWETAIESGLSKPFGRRGSAFSRDDKRRLEPLGLSEIATPLCAAAAEMAAERWLFKLDSHRGGTASVSGVLEKCIAQGRAVAAFKKDPSHVLTVCGTADRGKGGSYDCTVRAALFNATTKELAAYVEWSFNSKEKDLDKAMKKAGDEAYRMIRAGLK